MTRYLLGFAVAALSAFAACGGAVPPPAAPAASISASPSLATPGAECLAAASAKREPSGSQPEKISVRHVLVKYRDAPKKPDPKITRTREEACLRAMEARDKVRAGADFEEIVKEYSEEPGAASRGGLVSDIERKDVVPAFADAAFELDLNQLSDVVETDFGFHVLMRTK